MLIERLRIGGFVLVLYKYGEINSVFGFRRLLRYLAGDSNFKHCLEQFHSPSPGRCTLHRLVAVSLSSAARCLILSFGFSREITESGFIRPCSRPTHQLCPRNSSSPSNFENGVCT